MQPKSIMIYIFATHPHFSCFRLPILPRCRLTFGNLAVSFGHYQATSLKTCRRHVFLTLTFDSLHPQELSYTNMTKMSPSSTGIAPQALACYHATSPAFIRHWRVAGSGSIPITRSEKRQVTGYSGDLPFGAGEGNRTLIASLGSWSSATELHPQ